MTDKRSLNIYSVPLLSDQTITWSSCLIKSLKSFGSISRFMLLLGGLADLVCCCLSKKYHTPLTIRSRRRHCEICATVENWINICRGIIFVPSTWKVNTRTWNSEALVMLTNESSLGISFKAFCNCRSSKFPSDSTPTTFTVLLTHETFPYIRKFHCIIIGSARLAFIFFAFLALSKLHVTQGYLILQ